MQDEKSLYLSFTSRTGMTVRELIKFQTSNPSHQCCCLCVYKKVGWKVEGKALGIKPVPITAVYEYQLRNERKSCCATTKIQTGGWAVPDRIAHKVNGHRLHAVQAEEPVPGVVLNTIGTTWVELECRHDHDATGGSETCRTRASNWSGTRYGTR